MGHDAGLNNLGTIKEVKKKENISCIHLLNPIPIQNVAVFYQRKPPCVWQQRWNIQDIVSVYLQWAIVCALFVLRVCFLSSLDINHAPSQEWASSDDFNSWIVEFGISAERGPGAAPRSWSGFLHRGVCHFSSVRVLEGLNGSGVQALWSLSEAVGGSLFSQ